MAHILLAEDDEALATFLIKSLKRAGHRVTFARDGLEAYEKIFKEKFDLLLTDLAMPGMDGIDLVKKSREKLADLKVMFITGFSAVAIEANVDSTDIISKPFHLKELTDRIEILLKTDVAALTQELQKKITEKEVNTEEVSFDNPAIVEKNAKKDNNVE